MFLPTAPSRWFTDTAVAAWEREQLFPTTWQLAARRTELPPERGAFPVEVAGVPLVLTREGPDQYHALSNACRHRAGPVCREPGSSTRLVCAYHGWSYDLAGQLVHAPDFDLATLPTAQRQLPQSEIGVWEQWLFVRLRHSGGPSLTEWLGEMAAEVAPFRIADMRFERRMSYQIHCNWKVYIENFLEPYHLQMVHPSLFRLVDYGRYTITTRRWHSLQFSPPDLTGHDPLPLGTDAEAGGAKWYWAFPNFILNCSFGLVSMNLVLPRGIDQCEVICDFFLHPDQEPAEATQLIHYSHEVQLEDIAICEAVQRGLASGSYDRGVLHPAREVGVAHFVRLLEESGLS